MLRPYLFGLPARQVAADLAIGPNGVRRHIECMYQVAGVNSKEGLIAVLEATGLIDEWGWRDGLASVVS